jgi:tetratricopeptide (TPR) repeat protein
MEEKSALNWKSVLARLNRIAAARPRKVAALKQYLRYAPRVLCPIAVEVALEDGEPAGRALAEVIREVRDPALAVRIYELIPDRTVTLAAAAVAATELCLKVVRGGTTDSDLERGSLLNNYSVRLVGMGDYKGALKAAQEAVWFYRTCATRNAETFEPYLAMSLTTLAIRQGECGRLRPALRTAKDAVVRCRQLAAGNPQKYAEDLARAVMTLGNRHSAVGDRDLALDAGREASEIYSLLEEIDSQYAPDCALGLFVYANRLTESGRDEEALVPSKAAVHRFLALEARNKDAYQEFAAAALNTFALNLTDCGDPVESHEAAQGAVERFQTLHGQNPARFVADLISALNTVGECQANLGHPEEALQTARDALKYAEEFRRRGGVAARPFLTLTLTSLSHRLLAFGRPSEARRLSKRCVRLCRIGVMGRPELRSDLARALIHWANALRLTKASPKALKVAREAVVLLRRMARHDLAAFGSQLTSALSTLAACEADCGDRASALKHLRERVGVGRRLCEVSTRMHEPQLCIGLTNLAARLHQYVRPDEALEAISEALTRFERLADQKSAVYLDHHQTAREVGAMIHATNGKSAGTPQR